MPMKAKENDFDGCVIPLINFFTVPYAALYPLFWVPFLFSPLGFPVYCLYVWPICVLIWVLSLIVAHKHMVDRHFSYFIALSTILCVIVETALTFYLSFPDL